MNACKLLVLAAFCVIFLVLFVQAENENEISETDMELQGHNLREKRSFRKFPVFRCWLISKFRLKVQLQRVLREVDCQDNKQCQVAQTLLFGKIFKPPTPVPPMGPTPSPSSSPVMSETPSSSHAVSSMPAVSPTPSSSSVMVSQTL
ncbi:uncharacterized protein LOC111332517 isoform X2 [Stylophora pistillata]|uniref:uncharacterized protein LOC111332517 isoform X2 n=1 Tax=Stylophora pistillata TaxID=50429 RepID=UPI000C04E182|nr:uncharacterized protein LOC111332517 isoform X2 [Stylophora pistillata]